MKTFKKIAIKAAKEAGKILIDYYNKSFIIEETKTKELKISPDVESEKRIIRTINKEFPEHSIKSQKSGSQETNLLDNKSEYLWVIDSLDGVGNYSRHLPIYSASIALLKNNEPILGVIFIPNQNILVHAEKSKGTFLNNKRILVSNRKVSQAFAYIPSIWNDKEFTIKFLSDIGTNLKMNRILDSSVFSMAQVAIGEE